MSPPAETVATLLARHAARRAGGVPTVSVLVGPTGAGGRAWRRWAGETGHPVVTLTNPADAPAAWVAELARRTDLPAAAVDAVADRVGRDRAEFRVGWRGKTAADRARFWDATAGSASPAVRALAELAAAESPPAPAVVAAAVLTPDPFDAVRELASLVPPATVPALLFSPPTGANPTTWLNDVAAGAAAWATRLPALPEAVAVTGPVWESYHAGAPESRARAILREGVIEVQVRGLEEVAGVLTAAGLGAEVRAVGAILAAGGATDELVAAAADVARATAEPPADPAADDRARSAAERFLFELLESIPDTAGRVELNGALDFRFGPRAAEVDLLARADRVAVEVDGYFHFRGPNDYRRDRDKDYELQRRGYFVLRFLADDVVRRVELVRDRILEALTPRTREGRP